MPSPFETPPTEQPSTYIVQDCSNQQELERLQVQDHLFTVAMGGVLPEQDDPTQIRRLLDVGCGSGGWLIETARTYPGISTLIGIDVSRRMIEAARTQIQAQGLTSRMEFQVMDALRMLEFPSGYFDLVNLRFGISFLRTWDWPKLLSEMQRVCRPGGIVRVVEGELAPETTSPALTQFHRYLVEAFFQAGHLFTQDGASVATRLFDLLSQHGCLHAKSRRQPLGFQAGTSAAEAYQEDIRFLVLTLRPFLQKWGCLPKDYDALSQQVLTELGQSTFQIHGHLFTAWGQAPARR
ncbi:class I SAM-dependent methyltransferase [Ktedonosporobacter rubrisoli]|uniref:Class I SAM-dependent methyltransferase n=1 Tax=Ktedonosporobacter rubrisoli TaxID=2509675 RepID=A0A4P6JPV2_KTERU|nr:class I SAM-dependent methyltransferase [Ktedonosporobacter rubrisoli]QBD77419.1 class I SAM-dependent methyltransferase [Ktedonosporobacter rubrisoli]